MEKAELKQILKPLIKQCVKEIIFEEGVLSGIISEVVNGLGTTDSTKKAIVETKSTKQQSTKKTNKPKKQMTEAKKKLMSAIGTSAYSGIDLFEGTKPLSNVQAGHGGSHTPLSNIEPDNPGVDISNIPGVNTWKHLIK
jgi:hypothetical protein